MMVMTLEDSDQPDETLVAGAIAGDRAAFAALVERHYDYVYRVAYRLAGNRADAEDIAQEVCVRLGRAIRGFKGAGRFTTWLYALTLNAVRDMARKGAREARKAKEYGAQALIEGEVAEEPDDAAARLWAAVRQLPDKQRDAVTLVYGEGLSHADAADVMGLAEPTVSWHVHEAKKRLKQMMASAGDE